jgi:hypothetical protein
MAGKPRKAGGVLLNICGRIQPIAQKTQVQVRNGRPGFAGSASRM